MIASIPLALTEILSPDELGRLLDIADQEQRKPEDVIVLALRSFLSSRPIASTREEVPA